MAKVTIKNTALYTEHRTLKLCDVSSGRSVRLDNPSGQPDFYIVNKITDNENLDIGDLIPLTNYRTGRLVLKKGTLEVFPISAEVALDKFPENRS